jgi:hypothetical protein
MSVASPAVSVEKFRNRIDASSRATVFEVVQGNDKLLDTLRLPDTDDMRSSRNRTFAFPASAAAASGQTRKDSKAESDRDIPNSALGRSPGPLVSCFEFIDPARFYGHVMASGRRPASHAERIGVRKTFDFGGVQRPHRASFVEPDVFVELLRQIGPGNNGWRTRFRIRSIKGLRSAPSIDGNDSAASARFRTSVSSFGETGRSARRTRARASPSFAVAHPSANAETPPRFGNTGRPWRRSKCRHHRAPSDER